MTALTWIGLLVAGGVGASLRLLVDSAVARRFGARFPFGTLAVNLSGALVLGFLAALALPPPAALVVGTGVCGAYTTFSTWTWQSYELGSHRERAFAAANVVVPAVVGLAAAALGWWLGSLL